MGTAITLMMKSSCILLGRAVQAKMPAMKCPSHQPTGRTLELWNKMCKHNTNAAPASIVYACLHQASSWVQYRFASA
jgi:hypothetical protein